MILKQRLVIDKQTKAISSLKNEVELLKDVVHSGLKCGERDIGDMQQNEYRQGKKNYRSCLRQMLKQK